MTWAPLGLREPRNNNSSNNKNNDTTNKSNSTTNTNNHNSSDNSNTNNINSNHTTNNSTLTHAYITWAPLGLRVLRPLEALEEGLDAGLGRGQKLIDSIIILLSLSLL